MALDLTRIAVIDHRLNDDERAAVIEFEAVNPCLHGCCWTDAELAESLRILTRSLGDTGDLATAFLDVADFLRERARS